MTVLQKPGAQYTYNYVEYPAVRYHSDGNTRTIRSKEEEKTGWHDSPTKAREEANKLREKQDAINIAEKERVRAEKIKAGSGDVSPDVPPSESGAGTADVPPPNPAEPLGAGVIQTSPLNITDTDIARMNKEELIKYYLSLASKGETITDPPQSNNELKRMIKDARREQGK